MGRCCNISKRRWPLFVILAAVTALILFVWLSDANGQTAARDSAETVVTNQMCPVLKDEAIDPEQWVEYEGQRVYFCCPKCKRLFQRAPETYLRNLPQFAASSATADGPAEDHDQPVHSHADASSGDEHAHADATDDHGYEADSHDHAAHGRGEAVSGLARLIGWLGNFHPPSTDFPIALLISAAFAELLLIMTGHPMFDAAARFCVWLGSLGAVGAVTLGWFFAGFRLTDPDWIMTLHRWLGTAAGVWALVLLILCALAHRPNDRGRKMLAWYRLALFIAAAAVATNGFFGGAMIYGMDHYAW